MGISFPLLVICFYLINLIYLNLQKTTLTLFVSKIEYEDYRVKNYTEFFENLRNLI